MNATGDRTRELLAIDHRESRLLTAALGLLVLCAGAVVVADAGRGGSHVVRDVLFCALVVGFAADVWWRSRRLRRARHAVASAKYERLDLLRRVGEISDFVTALRRLDEAADGEELARRLAGEARRMCAADGAFVVARDAGGHAALAAVAGLDDAPGMTEPETKCFDQWLDQGAVPLLISESEAARARFGHGPLLDGASAVVAVPLIAGSRNFGGVVVVRRAAAAPSFDIGALQALALLSDAAGRIVQERDGRRRAGRQQRRHELSLQRLSRAQAELVRAEKSRAVADLVSSVAHELSNPLTAMVGYAQLLARRPELASGPAAEWAKETAREAERCGEILRRLSSFARRGAVEGPAEAPLDVIVKDVLALKAYDLRSAGVQVRTDIADRLPIPAMDRSLLQHVLLNLVNNAITALKTASVRGVGIEATEEDDRLVIRVSDTGPGIPSALRERIFDPFFTTRPVEDSAGLGLTTCRELVMKAGGSIELERTEDGIAGGATFVVRIPAQMPAMHREPEPAAV